MTIDRADDAATARRGSARFSAGQMVAALADSASAVRAVDLLDRRRHRSRELLSVLMYHRIADPRELEALPPELASASPEMFERQIEYLAARRPLVSLADVLAARRGERSLPLGAVTVTFDDAYCDFADHAWPVLRRHGVPVTLFVATGYPDRPDRAYWWDRLAAALTSASESRRLVTVVGTLRLGSPEERRAAYRRLTAWVCGATQDEAMLEVERLLVELDAPRAANNVLGWDRLRALNAEGVTMAAHSRTHPMLNMLPVERAMNEVVRSFSDLERELGAPPPRVLAYPGGGHSSELVEKLRAGGVEAAFTTEHGVNDLREADWLRLARINVGPRTTAPAIGAQMLPHVADSRLVRATRRWARRRA